MKVIFKVNGRVVSRRQFCKVKVPSLNIKGSSFGGRTAYSSGNPLLSVSAGCPKAQVSEFREFIQKNKLRDVDVRADGKIEFTSRAGRREYLKARNIIDQDGGYSDG